MRINEDTDGREVSREPWPLPEHCRMGSGYPLSSYRPTQRERMHQFVSWTLSPVTVEEDAGMVGPKVANQRNRDIFPNKPDRPDAGLVTFAWPVFPICKQKLVEVNLFDPQAELFGHGAHMPLMVFVGDKSRRTPQAWRRRERNADY